MNIHNRTTRGFTLIELLVVIAIIGILASVVLASLNSARDKGADAAIKSTVNNARAQAELFYDDGSTYAGVCDDSTDGIAAMVAGATSAGSAAVVCAEDTTPEGWALQAQLKADTTEYYCVDSTGRATTTGSSSITDTSDAVCG